MPLLLDDSPVETFQSVSGFGIFQLLPWIMSQGPACMEIWSPWLRSTWQIPGVLGLPGRKSQYPRRRYGDTQWNRLVVSIMLCSYHFFLWFAACFLPAISCRESWSTRRLSLLENSIYIIIIVDAPYMCIYIYMYIYVYIYMFMCIYIYIYIY